MAKWIKLENTPENLEIWIREHPYVRFLFDKERKHCDVLGKTSTVTILHLNPVYIVSGRTIARSVFAHLGINAGMTLFDERQVFTDYKEAKRYARKLRQRLAKQFDGVEQIIGRPFWWRE